MARNTPETALDLAAVARERNERDGAAGVIPRHIEDPAPLLRLARLLAPYLDVAPDDVPASADGVRRTPQPADEVSPDGAA